MTITTRHFILPAILLITFLLTSCGGSSSLPPERPYGQVTGFAIDSAIKGGTVSVYSYANGVRGEKLGGGTTDAAGAFQVKIYAPSQLVLVEVTGGSYVEEATGTTVSLKNGETLDSLVNYQFKQTVSTNVTPLTHMATALAEYKIENGATVKQAIDDAFGTINDFFSIDSRGTNSVNITNEKSGPIATLSNDILYGFYLAGLSHWTMEASRKNNVPPHTTYTSVGLAQIIYNDIRSDGLLNGQGYNNDKTQLVPLAMGPSVPLNADEYRSAFSIHMLAMANLTMNKTGLGVTELTDVANAIADKTNATTTLLDADQPVDISVRDINISLAQPKDGYYHGILDFNLSVTGILGIDKIEVQVDGGLPNDGLVGDPMEQPIQIDTTHFADASHDITVQVWNALGNTDTLMFTTQFDNTGPIITSSGNIPALVNVTTLPLSLTVDANVASLQSIEAISNGNNTVLSFSGGQWHTTLDLTPGENTFVITAIDKAGNATSLNKTIFVDQIPPVINTDAGHGDVQLSNGDGTSYTSVLANDNLASDPLYLDTNYAGFNTYGKALSRTTLNSDKIPYFAFTVSDERAAGVATQAEDMSVRMQYQRSGIVLNDWHELSVQPQCKSTANATVTKCEYLIPLLSEILDPPQNIISPWQETTPQQPHYIRIELNDGAGNTVTAEFSFKVDFYVPSIPLCGDQACTQGELMATDLDPFTGNFSVRDTLLNTNLQTTSYTFQNPSSNAIYISLSDSGAHQVTQAQEQEIRVHQVRKTTTTSWQVQTMNPIILFGDPCFGPGTPYNIGENGVTLQNWNGKGWDPISPLQPTIIEEYPLNSDTLPDASSLKNAAADIDGLMFHQTLAAAANNRAYDFDADYRVLDINQEVLGYAKISNWKYINTANSAVLLTCPDQRAFYETVATSYKSIDGPRDARSDLPPQTYSFGTDGYVVSVNSTPLQSANGWYLIPAGADVVITKEVLTQTTPQIMAQEADFTADASYTVASVRDKSLTWDIDRNLTITAIHDAGETNIGAMSQRNTSLDAGVKTYVMSRP